VPLYLVISASSPQNFTGIEGSGLVITISPTSPTTASPASLNAYAATPRLRLLVLAGVGGQASVTRR